MAKYHRLPQLVDAIQYVPDNTQEIAAFLGKVSFSIFHEGMGLQLNIFGLKDCFLRLDPTDWLVRLPDRSHIPDGPYIVLDHLTFTSTYQKARK